MKIDKSLEMKVKDLVSKLEYYHDEMEYEFEETLYELRELLSKNLPKEFKEIGYYDGYRQVLVAANIGYVKYLYVYSNYGSYTSSDVLSYLLNDFPELIDDVIKMVDFGDEDDEDSIIDSILSDNDTSEEILQGLGEKGVIDYYDFETNPDLQYSITDYLMEMVKGYLVDYNVIDEEVFDSMFESDEPLSEEEWVFLGYILLGDEFLKYGRLFEDTDVKPVVVNLGERE